MRHRLIRRCGRLLLGLRQLIVLTEQPSQKARSMRRLRPLLLLLLNLLLQLPDLRLRLVESDVLHQNGLRQHVKRIGIRAELLVDQRFGVRIFFLKLCLVYPLDERVKKLFFLGSQRNNLRRPATAGSGRLSLLRRDPAGKVAPPRRQYDADRPIVPARPIYSRYRHLRVLPPYLRMPQSSGTSTISINSAPAISRLRRDATFSGSHVIHNGSMPRRTCQRQQQHDRTRRVVMAAIRRVYAVSDVARVPLQMRR